MIKDVIKVPMFEGRNIYTWNTRNLNAEEAKRPQALYYIARFICSSRMKLSKDVLKRIINALQALPAPLEPEEALALAS